MEKKNHLKDFWRQLKELKLKIYINMVKTKNTF